MGLKEAKGEEFLSLVREGGWLLALFYADWCSFCRAFFPLFQKAADRRGSGIRMVAVDISEEEDPLWEAFGIENVPTLILFRDGREVGRRMAPLGIGLKENDLEALLGMMEGEGES